MRTSPIVMGKHIASKQIRFVQCMLWVNNMHLALFFILLVFMKQIHFLYITIFHVNRYFLRMKSSQISVPWYTSKSILLRMKSGASLQTKTNPPNWPPVTCLISSSFESSIALSNHIPIKEVLEACWRITS